MVSILWLKYLANVEITLPTACLFLNINLKINILTFRKKQNCSNYEAQRAIATLSYQTNEEFNFVQVNKMFLLLTRLVMMHNKKRKPTHGKQTKCCWTMKFT